jgi:hypothetical protein
MTDPTLGELLRRLDVATSTMNDLAAEMRRDRRDVEATYVRKDVYDRDHKVVSDDITDLQDYNKDREKREADTRRQLVFLMLAIAVPAILGLLLAVNNFISAGGQTP